MPKIKYITKRFSAEHEQIVNQANLFIAQFQAQGFTLSLRQLYYRFIAADAFPASWINAEYNKKHGLPPTTKNTMASYDKLGKIISNARRAGLVDWDAIEDRGRNLQRSATWDSPAAIVAACAAQFDVDRWADQPYRVECFVEKDALLGVLEAACRPWQLPYLSCRGYISDSEIWSAAQRMVAYDRKGQIPLVLHLGDHDPSGIDATRDIERRINLFSANTAAPSVEVRRLALNRDQVELYDPPPNPAKTTDARYQGYEREHGDESWELDALEPTVIANLIADTVRDVLDQDAWNEAEAERTTGRRTLRRISRQWDDVVSRLGPEVRSGDDDEDEDDE